MDYNYIIDIVRLMREHSQRLGVPVNLRDVEVGSGLSYVTLQNIKNNPGSYSKRSLDSLCNYFQRPVEEIVTNGCDY